MSLQNAAIFDDDELFCYLFAKIFRSKDVDVTTYANPDLYFCSDPSINSCPVEAPCVDFLLTDHFMPDMTGLEFLKRLKHMGCKIPDCRKAIVSAEWSEENIKTAKQLVSNIFDKSDSKNLIAAWIEESSE